MKTELICPNCQNLAIYDSEKECYHCSNCKWDSNNSLTIDISYKDSKTGALSNLFPHKFVIDNIRCASMESFLQSLREENPDVQERICSDYAGLHAYKLRTCLNDWRKEGYIFWQGTKIKRESDGYTILITRAYDALFEQNIVFRRVLSHFSGCYLIHSIGNDDIKETLLTEKEYRFQLNRLVDRLKKEGIYKV